MAEPVDGQVVDDDDEPGGERAVRVDVGGAAPQASEIILAEGFAHPGEDVHDVVVFGGVVADRPEDEAAVALDEEIPRGVGITCLERSDPGFHHGRAGPPLSRFLLPSRHGRAARGRASGFIASESFQCAPARPAVKKWDPDELGPRG